MTKRTFGAVLVAAVLSGSAALAQAPAIAVFNAQRVWDETAEGKRLQGELEQLSQRKQEELNALQGEIQEMNRQLTTQELSLSSDKKLDLQTEMEKRLLDLQARRESAQRELQRKEIAAQNRFSEQLVAVLDQIGRNEQFTVVLEASAVAWASPTVDITSMVVEKFDSWVQSPEASEADAPSDGGGRP